MMEFFAEGGWGMWPVLVIGMVLIASAGRYAFDREPVRMRFIAILSWTYLAFIAMATLTDVATVLWAVSSEDTSGENWAGDKRLRIFLEGMKECTRPGVMGLAFLCVALVLVCIGVYRSGLRELRAARG
jgi:hypothetical protein